jgi:hypothetical protein
MFNYYAKFLAGAQDYANGRIEESMRRWADAAAATDGQPQGIRPGNAPERLVRGGTPVGDIGRIPGAAPRRR